MVVASQQKVLRIVLPLKSPASETVGICYHYTQSNISLPIEILKVWVSLLRILTSLTIA